MTSNSLTILVAQLNFWVGDIQRNLQTIIQAIHTAKHEFKADLVVFPELALSGYPPEDLLFRPEFSQRMTSAIDEIAKHTDGIDVLLGYPQKQNTHFYNAAIWLREGKLLANYQKQELPNYSVFDENRYFSQGHKSCVVSLKGIPIGVLICEDIWYPKPVEKVVNEGARLIICLNSSPFHVNKIEQRVEIVKQRIAEQGVPMIYAHLVGGQDELIFDGGTMLFDRQGTLCQRASLFKEELVPLKFMINDSPEPMKGPIAPLLDEVESVYQALVLGVRDYVRKNYFSGVLIGLSGGIDSALTAAIAVDALGAEAVKVVLMPSRYTASMSVEDAICQAKCLGVDYLELSIEPAFQAFLDILAKPFAGYSSDTTEENIQARCRGTILMALSNKMGRLVLTTGNKSELALGYSTLYGDMAGGFDVLKDVSKTLVYQLARYRNQIQRVIPERVLERAPSAELAPNQKDEDTLPPYAILDQILTLYIEKQYSTEQLLEMGFPKVFVDQVIRRIHSNEHKRRQSPPGIRVTPLAFGRDWRYPITSGFLANK